MQFLPRFFLSCAVATLTLGVAPAASPAWLTAHDAEVRAVVARMTLDEKVGQMTQPDLGAIKDLADITRLHLGSVLSGGSSDPAAGNTLAAWADLHVRCQALAAETRLGIPLLYGIDAVHGHNNVLGAVIFPHNIGLGATRDPALIREISEVTAAEIRATGIAWAFAPCLAVPQDIRWGRTYEGYSSDPAVVASFAAPAVRGLQGADLSGLRAVLGCAKHFVGDGGTTYGSAKNGRLDQGDTPFDEATLRAVHLAGYPDAIAAGVGSIMPSYSSWNGEKLSGSHYLLTEVLKDELGFAGFLISDYNAIDQLVDAVAIGGEAHNAAGQVHSNNYKRCIELSINAGMDMVMVTERYGEFITLLKELVHEKRVPMARIDDAVTRILRVKFAMGLTPGARVEPPSAELQAEFGSEAHRAVARRAVRQSLVLLKNEDGVLPLASADVSRLHVVGRGADDLGMQCGGWTIDWQGKRGDVTPGGTTILAALRKSLGAALPYSINGDDAAGGEADTVVVVVGEEPYAEGLGDVAIPALAADDAALVARMKAAGKRVVLVLLTGRPLILGEVADQADAIVAAWLPGTEGDGVADGLLGRSPFTGTLPYAWPRRAADLPESGDPLFPRGFRL